MSKPRRVVRASVARDDLPEREWQKVLVNGLEEERWTVNHIGRARTASGDWVTPTTSSGWPDLLAVRGPRLLAVEVKGRRTPLALEQVAWLLLFAEIPTAHAWVLRPSDNWREIARWIQRPENAPTTHGFDPMALGGQEPGAFLAQKRAAPRSAHGSPGVRLSQPPEVAQEPML